VSPAKLKFGPAGIVLQLGNSRQRRRGCAIGLTANGSWLRRARGGGNRIGCSPKWARMIASGFRAQVSAAPQGRESEH